MSLRLAILLLGVTICAVAAGQSLMGPQRIQLTLPAGAVKVPPEVDQPRAPPQPGTVLQAQNWFSDFFGSPEPGRGRSRSRQPSLDPEDAPAWSEDDGPSLRERRSPYRYASTYRTVCVRLCDGYYWPISFSTNRERFSRDAQICETACPGKSRLFVHQTGSDDVDNELSDMEDRPYSDLENAFRFRREYVADCTCRANPWDGEALARHRAYAEADKAAKTKEASPATTARLSKTERVKH